MINFIEQSIYYETCRCNIFTFLFFKTIRAQSIGGQISYELKLVEDNLFYPATLYFNKDSAIFQFKNYKEKKWVRDEGIGRFDVVNTDIVDRLVISSVNKNSAQFFVRDFCGTEAKIYFDTVNIQWTISDEKKLISDFLCKKAIGRFRGRDYIAWFCPEINLSIDPYKYGGLPGLILEITTTDEALKIYATKISLADNQFIKLPSLKDKIVSRKDFNLCLDDDWKKEYYNNKARIAKLQKEFPDIVITDGPFQERSKYATEVDE